MSSDFLIHRCSKCGFHTVANNWKVKDGRKHYFCNDCYGKLFVPQEIA